MNDPHVVALRYRLEAVEGFTFDNPSPIEWEVPVCIFRVADGIVTATLRSDFASVEEARAAVEPHLHAFPLRTMLDNGRAVFTVQFSAPVVEDRKPPPASPGSPQVIVADTLQLNIRTYPPTVHQRWRDYPPPPGQLLVSPDVETLWHRYEGWRAGREPLPAAAYFCLTVVVGLRGRRGPSESITSKPAPSDGASVPFNSVASQRS
jgi:hypothetical protein